MKVLYILSGTEIRGGATKSFLSMADAVASAGHDVAVIVPDEKGVTSELKSRGWDVLVVPYMFATLPYLSWSFREIAKFIPRYLKAQIINRKAKKIVNNFAKSWNPDLIHDNTSVIDLGHYAAAELKIPHVIHIREYGWRDFRRIIPGLRKRLSSSNTFVIAITADLASFRGKGLQNSHLRVIYNGIVNKQSGGYNSKKEPFFLYAGRIRRAKGADDLIQSYLVYAKAEISAGRTPLSLKMAGNNKAGGFIEEMKKQITEAGLENFVEWLGEISIVDSLYSRAAATVIPSKSEGFGRVMPEAMSAGSLCVVRRAGGLEEQLENGRRECGREIAFGYDSREELSSILLDIASAYRNDKEYEEGGRFYQMIDDSRKVVEQLYSYEANAKGVLKYYNDIIKDNLK